MEAYNIFVLKIQGQIHKNLEKTWINLQLPSKTGARVQLPVYITHWAEKDDIWPVWQGLKLIDLWALTLGGDEAHIHIRMVEARLRKQRQFQPNSEYDRWALHEPMCN